ncbi:Ribosomal RNA-processing protein 14/surfeit locus protein 6 C-terminal domain [Trinorchestia longiramus]|nr:Ribosomal RNA-processing protein 14/surfeit locus protein 6 C-terminal domain [Trinorchestia longiramus]
MVVLQHNGGGTLTTGNPKKIIKQRLKTRAVRKRQAIQKKAEIEQQKQINSIGNIDAFSPEDEEIFNDFPMLPIIEEPCTWNETKRNEVMSLWCRVLGVFPVITSPACPAAYVPLAEKKRQLANATTEKQRLKLMAKYGLLTAEANQKKAAMKEQLRLGELVLERVLPGRMDTEYSLKAALQMCESRHDTIKPEEGLKPKKDRAALLQKIKEREEQKEARLKAKEVVRRKKAMDHIAESRQNKKLALIEAALNSYDADRAEALKKLILPQATEEEPEKHEEEDDRSVDDRGSDDSDASLRHDELELASSAQNNRGYVFNLPGAVRDPIKTKRKTLEELKTQLAEQKQKRKLLSQLHEVKEDELANKIENQDGWTEAEKKIIGEKVENASSLARDIKRVEKHKKNKGKKLDEVLKRQKEDKRQRMLKRRQNVRSRRVDKLVKKMKGLKKKGTYVPGFM